MGKMHRSSIPRASTSRTSGVLDLIHTDVAGPLPVMSNEGAKYFVTFIDDHSRWLSVYPIRSKSECFSYFRLFKNVWKRKQGVK